MRCSGLGLCVAHCSATDHGKGVADLHCGLLTCDGGCAGHREVRGRCAPSAVTGDI